MVVAEAAVGAMAAAAGVEMVAAHAVTTDHDEMAGNAMILQAADGNVVVVVAAEAAEAQGLVAVPKVAAIAKPHETDGSEAFKSAR